LIETHLKILATIIKSPRFKNKSKANRSKQN